MGFPICMHSAFAFIREALHPLNLPSTMEKGGANIITNADSRATNTEITPLEIMFMDGVGKGKLEMITTFCRSDEAKVKPSAALLTLVQWDSPRPGVVVMKVFSNLPYFLQGSFSSPYLDVTTLSSGTFTTQFPLALLYLCRLLPYSPTQVILP